MYKYRSVFSITELIIIIKNDMYTERVIKIFLRKNQWIFYNYIVLNVKPNFIKYKYINITFNRCYLKLSY